MRTKRKSQPNNDAPEPSKTLAPDYESMKYASLRNVQTAWHKCSWQKSGPNKEIDAGGPEGR